MRSKGAQQGRVHTPLCLLAPPLLSHARLRARTRKALRAALLRLARAQHACTQGRRAAGTVAQHEHRQQPAGTLRPRRTMPTSSVGATMQQYINDS